jgi:hypothetical protein
VGYVLNKEIKNQYQLAILADKQLIAAKTLQKTGPLEWRIPLTHKNNKDSLPIEFTLTPLKDSKIKKTSSIVLQADRVELTGFLNPQETITVEQSHSHCKNSKNELVCRITVPNNINLIQLPMFYYPKLLKVTLNNKPVSYSGVLVDGKIVVGISAEPGRENIIKAKFVGLWWANLASQICWGLWILVLVIYLFLRRRSRC